MKKEEKKDKKVKDDITVIMEKPKPCLTLHDDDYIDGLKVGDTVDKSFKLKLVSQSEDKIGDEITRTQRFEVVDGEKKEKKMKLKDLGGSL